jgi:hypothetical protein
VGHKRKLPCGLLLLLLLFLAGWLSIILLLGLAQLLLLHWCSNRTNRQRPWRHLRLLP